MYIDEDCLVTSLEAGVWGALHGTHGSHCIVASYTASEVLAVTGRCAASSL